MGVWIIAEARAEEPDVAALAEQREQAGDLEGARRAAEQRTARALQEHGEGSAEVGDARLAEGLLLVRIGDRSAGLDALERARDAHARAYGGQHEQVAIDAYHLGRVRADAAEYAPARAAYEQALAILEIVHPGDHEDVATVLNDLGLLLGTMSAPADGLAPVRRALEMRRRLLGEDHADVGVSWNNLARLEHESGDVASAHTDYERSLDIALMGSDPEGIGVAITRNNLGWLLQTQGRYAEAQGHYEAALVLLERLVGPDHPNVGVVVNNLALLQQYRGNFAASLPLYARALAILERALGDTHPQVATLRNNLAGVLHGMGDFSGARALYERSLAATEAALGPDHPDVATGLNNLAHLVEVQGDHALAREMHERAYDIRVRALGPTHRDVATSLNNLSACYRRQGDDAAARRALERALEVWRGSVGEVHPDAAATLHQLGVLLQEQGDLVGAATALERAWSIRREVLGPTHEDVASSLQSLGDLAWASGDLSRAADLLTQAKQLRTAALGPDHPEVAQSWVRLGVVAQAQGDLDAAARSFANGLETTTRAFGPDHHDVGAILAHQASLAAAAGQLDEARAGYERALDVLERALTPDHPEVAMVRARLASLCLRRGEPDDARAHADRALRILEGRFSLLDGMSEREALAFLQQATEVRDVWLAAFDRPTDDDDAWSSVSRWKGVVTQRMRERQAGAWLEDPEGAALFADLTRARAERAALELHAADPAARDARDERLAVLVADGERLERALAARSATWRDVQGRATRTFDDRCAAVPPDVALVDLVLRDVGGEPRYDAFVVRACDVTRVQLGPADEVDARIAAWRARLADPAGHTSAVDARGARVTEAVWAPVAAVIGQVSEVWFSPDGALAALPFAALPVGAHRYLVEDVTVRVVADALDLTASGAAAPGAGLLAVGGLAYGLDVAPGPAPACGAPGFLDLPQTRDEVDALAGRWAGHGPRREPITMLTGAQGDEASVRSAMATQRVVHFATHGYFTRGGCGGADATVPSDPMMWSGLALAGANVGGDRAFDDVLIAREIGALDLRGTELVVLSACASGLGVQTTGQGVLGLQRAFAVSGATTVVASLWSVPDAATAELMGAFYRGVLSRGGVGDAAVALSEAQRALIQRRRLELGEARPQDWAAFVVSGVPAYRRRYNRSR